MNLQAMQQVKQKKFVTAKAFVFKLAQNLAKLKMPAVQ